jgi:hypothetical protein
VFWLFTQVWVWTLVALLLGLLAGWWFWGRPPGRATEAPVSGRAGRTSPG